MKKKICLDGLKKVLSPNEMKNVTGGSGCVRVECGNGEVFYINGNDSSSYYCYGSGGVVGESSC